MKAIGVFGGAFAPFHNGHLRVAIEARERLGLTQLRLIPTAHPPHRRDSRVSPMRRLEWVKAAVRREKGLVADDREILRDGPSYTVDTLTELRAEFPQAALVLLMGADAFAHLHSWNRWTQLLDLAHLAVVTRPGAVPEPSREAAERLQGCRATHLEALHEQPAGLWLPLELPPLDISSTRIRRLLKQGLSVRGLVPDAILNAMTAADVAALTQDDDATKH
ncbi:MAG TPA: nicotinate-nucleotide adenylyltransferase [Solimonas sp.]|nr:nicotinate-nucleotide adenylyltransferase [Solimonas sp.]